MKSSGLPASNAKTLNKVEKPGPHDRGSVQVAAPNAKALESTHGDYQRATNETPRLLPLGAKKIEPKVHPRKVAVVTGGSTGMGLETCRQLAAEGFTVVLTSRNIKKGKEAAQQLRDEGYDVVYQRLDVTVPRSANALAGYLKHTYGRVDVLVNNAGALHEDLDGIEHTEHGGLLDIDADVLKKTYEVNTFGPINVARALAPMMREAGSGRIINISSRLASDANMGLGIPAYRMSKASLNIATQLLAEELKEDGIQVNAVDPGWVKTKIGGTDAPTTVEEGVKTTLYLATLPDDDERTGGFFNQGGQIDW